MGVMLLAKCSCGYTRDKLFIGIGDDPGHDMVLATCPTCKEILDVDRFDPNHLQYRVCQGQLSILEDVDPDKAYDKLYYLLDGKYTCPRCEEPKMTLLSVGVWD